MGLKGIEYLGGTPDAPEEVKILATLFMQDMNATEAYENAIGFLEDHDGNLRSDVLLQAADAIRQAANAGQITYVRDVEDILRVWAREEAP